MEVHRQYVGMFYIPNSYLQFFNTFFMLYINIFAKITVIIFLFLLLIINYYKILIDMFLHVYQYFYYNILCIKHKVIRQ